MSVYSEVKRAYTEKTRKLDFLASRPVRATSLPVVLKAIGEYNQFYPSRVARAIMSVDKRASVYVGREGSPALYIKTTPAKAPKMRAALRAAKADEIGTKKGYIRAWWD